MGGQKAFPFILKMIRPFPGSIAIMFLVACVWAIDVSLRPYILKVILNRVTEAPSQEIFTYLAFPASSWLLMSFLLSSIFRLYGYFVEFKMIPDLRQKIAYSCFDDLLKQSHHYYQNQFSGSLVNKVDDLINSIPDIVQVTIDRFFSHFLALAIAIFVLWQVNAKFALLMLSWTTLFVGMSIFMSRRLIHLSDIWAERGTRTVGRMVDVLSNILSVKLFSRIKQEKLSFEMTLQKTIQAEKNLQWTYFLIWCVYGYSFVILQGFNLYFLIEDKRQGLITLGDFALVLSINTAIVEFFWNLVKEISNFSKASGKISQALRTLVVTPDIQDRRHARELVVSKGEIIFEDIQFSYQGSNPLFQNKSVKIESGQKVGLVGYSGSGKSTFVNLILRLFDVTSGQITVDGQDIRHVTQDSLRANIGMIPQDPSLFHRTLRENIRYGKANATDEEIVEASKKAHAHAFISALAQGYDSLVGERGVKLSGGQRQRIAIARAILKNAPLLILDEATSQLDSVTEGDIQDSFDYAS